MSLLAVLAVVAAGLGAGTINAVVGSGSFITFPTLVGVGFAPVLANVSNTVGLVPGSLSAVVAYRKELEGQRGRVLRIGGASVAGGLLGGVLLLSLPGTVFERAVPVLILVACGLMVAQPRITAWLKSRGDRHPHGGIGLLAAVFATGVYGGYFGAAQGVILMALLAISIEEDLQRLNAVKNVLALLANGAAAVLFIAATHINWEAAGLVAAGSVVGGQVGGILGRKIPQRVLRVVVVGVGLAVAGVLFVRYW